MSQPPQFPGQPTPDQGGHEPAAHGQDPSAPTYGASSANAYGSQSSYGQSGDGHGSGAPSSDSYGAPSTEPYDPSTPVYGASSSDGFGSQGGYGSQNSFGSQGGYGEQSSSGFGESSANSYGTGSANSVGASSANTYGAGSANSFGTGSASGFGESSANTYGTGSANTFGASSASEFGSSAPAPGYSGAPAAPAAASGGSKPKWPWIVGGCCALLALAVIIGAIGLFAFARNAGSEPVTVGTTDPSIADPATTDPATGTTTDPASGATTDPAPAPAGGTGDGTPESPFSFGSPVTVGVDGGNLEVVLGDLNPDATAEILEYNQFNPAPAEGSKYMMVPVTATYHGTGEIDAWMETGIFYVTADGTQVYEAPVVAPEDPSAAPALADGASVTFQLAFEVPAGDDGSGLMVVGPLFGDDDEYFYVSTK